MEKENFISNLNDLICPCCLNPQSTLRAEDTYEACSYCKEKFSYQKCYHCKRKVYFKSQNFTDGVNIKCPYSDCNKWFCKSSCGVCNSTLYFPDRYQEGTKVKCPFKTCGQEYYKIICPNDKCNSRIVFKPSNNNENSLDSSNSLGCYKEGNTVACGVCKITFQKISCYECLRKLVWIGPNKMIEGQKLVCPYEDCNKSVNKIFCPHCQKCNIFIRGGMEFGSKIKCIYRECGKYYNKIFCPSCTRPNIFVNGNFVEGVKTTCVYSNCQKKFCLVNCHYCKRVNFWYEGYILGQNIFCSYLDCGKKFAKVNCPKCTKINVFPNGDYCFGKSYKCVYPSCSQEFSNFLCPGCYTFLNLPGKYLEGNKVVCGMNNCKTCFINFRCPHCMQIILDKGATYKYGQSVICPYSNCRKNFNYLYCVGCRRGIYYKDNNYIEGQVIKCPYSDCSKNFIFVYCPKCEKHTYIEDRMKNLTNYDEVQCCNPICAINFRIGTISNIRWSIGVAFYPKQGIPFDFHNPMKEIREEEILNSIIINDNLYKNDGNQISQEDNQPQRKETNEPNPISGKKFINNKISKIFSIII
jgi:hypothetical protein